MSKRIDDLVSDIKDIKTTQVDVIVKLTEYNGLLDQHIKRTELLEDRVKPIEEHVLFLRKLGGLFVSILGILASCAAIVRYLL